MLPARAKNFYQVLADILPIRGSTSAQRHFRKQLMSTANKHIYVPEITIDFPNGFHVGLMPSRTTTEQGSRFSSARHPRRRGRNDQLPVYPRR